MVIVDAFKPFGTVRGDFGAGAVFSGDDRHRYVLWRQWSAGMFGHVRYTHFVMLNPSTADHERLDPTVTRCRNFARGWGDGGLIVTNLSSLRSTDPRGLLRAAEDLSSPDRWDGGALNVRAIMRAHEIATRTIVAWGGPYSPTRLQKLIAARANEVLRILLPGPVFALAKTAAGRPRHPLYLPSKSCPLEYP